MKIKENFVLRQLADTWVVLPLADKTIDFNGMITLNESGVLLWNALEKGADVDMLVKLLTAEYDVSAQRAQADAEEFVQKLHTAGCLDMQ